MRFFAIMDRNDDAVGVFFPDCPGCTAMGNTEEEAISNAFEALAEWMEDRSEAERPRPRSARDLACDPDVMESLKEGGVFISVPLLLEGGKPTTANVSLPRGLLQTIDAAAAHEKMTRSAFIAAAARERIKKAI